MFALRDSIVKRAPLGFPHGVVFGYAVAMPDISFNVQSPEWESWQVIDRDTLTRPISAAIKRLAAEQKKMVPSSTVEPSSNTIRIIQRLLRPDFEIVVTQGTQIEETEMGLLRLTEEQFDAIDLLVDNERCLFEGAAGTGKTMLALEYAKRSAASGKRTLLICYNSLLGNWLERQVRESTMPTSLTAGSYFKLLRDVILTSSIGNDFRQEESVNADGLFQNSYAPYGKMAVEEQEEPYEILVMDEAQDLLRPGVLEVLNVWLKGGLREGGWAIFGDFLRQAIFSPSTGDEMKKLLSTFSTGFAKGRLSLNCRNTKNIGEETALMSGFASPPYRMGQVSGLPVEYQYYGSKDAQREMLVVVIKHLLAGGVRPRDIVVLSRLRLSHSGIAGIPASNDFQLLEAAEPAFPESRIPSVRFTTIQAFKGMESPVLILCDIDQVADDEPMALLYVAMSRARSQLIVLVNEKAKPYIGQCFRRKLEKGWSSGA